jgi:hypothetical protein
MKPSDIQSLVESRLRQFPEFSGIRIILEREGDIATKITMALKTAGGECRPGTALVIETASASVRQVQAARLVVDPLAVEITAFENDLFNKPPAGTGKRAGDLALEAAAALCGWTPPGCKRPLSFPAGENVREASDGKGGAAASVTLATAIEMPALRLPGEYGYNAATAL